METNLDLVLGPFALSEAATKLQESQSRVDSVFRELALYDVSQVNERMAELLASKIEEVKQHRPDLTDVEATIVAGRLMKQLILCWKSGLDQLLA